MRISDWSSDVCSSDLPQVAVAVGSAGAQDVAEAGVPHRRRQAQVDEAGPGHLDGGDLRNLLQAGGQRRGEIARLLASRLGEHHRSEEHTSELQSLMRISYAVFCLKKKNNTIQYQKQHTSKRSPNTLKS